MKLQVLLPVYNVGTYVETAVRSILDQTFTDFELVVLDDASTDNTKSIVSRMASSDSRIRFLKNERNTGIITSRNKLFDLSTADYLAIMDGDDWCYPDRLEKQIGFLETHKNIAAVGCAFEFIGEKDGYFYPPETHKKIMTFSTLFNVMLNPGMVIRRQVLLENNIRYDKDYAGSADYDMWLRLGKVVTLANLSNVLMKYRVHSTQESTANEARQKSAHLRIMRREFLHRGLDEDTEIFKPLVWPEMYADRADIERIGRAIGKIFNAYGKDDIDMEEMFRLWDFRYRGACRRKGLIGLATYIRTRGITSMVKGKNRGMNFVLDCFFRRD